MTIFTSRHAPSSAHAGVAATSCTFKTSEAIKPDTLCFKAIPPRRKLPRPPGWLDLALTRRCHVRWRKVLVHFRVGAILAHLFEPKPMDPRILVLVFDLVAALLDAG